MALSVIKGKSPDGGWTLLELAVVLAAMSLMATVAIIRFSASQSGAVRSAAEGIVSDVAYAQELARQTNKGTEVTFTNTPNPPRRCFIATACYGEESVPVASLRALRDRALLKMHWGRGFVRWYYHTGPKLARTADSSPVLRQALRAALLPAAAVARALVGEAYAFGGGGGGGGGSGDEPNSYRIRYQDGTQINHPQGGGPYVVNLGDRVSITSPNRTIEFDSSGKLTVVGYSWGANQTSMVLVTLNDEVNIYIARHTGKLWIQ